MTVIHTNNSKKPPPPPKVNPETLGYGKKDGISKCRAGDDFFSVIQNNGAVKKKAEVFRPVDTVESSLEKKAIDLLKAGQGPNDILLVIARVGKVVFLIILLPPYLTLYSLPKLVMFDLAPRLFHFANPLLKESYKYVKSKLETNKVIQFVKNFSSQFSIKAAEYSKWISKLSKTLFTHLKHPILALQERFIKHFFNPTLKGARVAEKAAKLLKIKAGKQTEIAKEMVNVAVNMIKNEAIKQIQPYLQPLLDKYQATRKKLTHLMDAAIKKIEKFKAHTAKMMQTIETSKDTILNQTLHFTKQLQGQIVLFIQPVKQWLETSREQVKKWQNEQVIQPLKNKYEQVRNFVQSVAKNFNELVKEGVKAASLIWFQQYEKIKNNYQKPIFDLYKKFKEQQKNKWNKFNQFYNKQNAKIFKLINDTLTKSKSLLTSIVENFLNLIKQTFISLKKIPGLLIYFSKTFFKQSIQLIKESVIVIIAIGFWTKVTFKFFWKELLDFKIDRRP